MYRASSGVIPGESKPVSTRNAAPSLYLCPPRSVATHFPELGPVEWRRDLSIEFSIAACDAHSFGIMLQTDSSGKRFRLQFIPSSNGLFAVVLLTDLPLLDDFWADHCHVHVNRPIDGPELVRHDCGSLTDRVFIFLRGQLVEVFCGGRSLSFRLPKLPGWDGGQRDGVRRFGVVCSRRYGGRRQHLDAFFSHRKRRKIRSG